MLSETVSLHSPFVSPQLTGISQKVTHSPEAPILATATQEILPDCLALVASKA